ncbi:MAG: hypothetical protein MH204_08930, partial [Fimbriimonadaceae bacterium]|nr:hypothetical protein [Fimbriimonadaceae bacterium]
VCLGGGLEMAAGCTRIVASPETMIGLPEGSVGLVPGGGGTVLMRLRTQQNARRMAESIVALAEGWTADNAESARLAGLLRSCDLTARHPDRLLAEAKALALSVQPEPLPDWAPLPGPVAGMADDLIAKARKSGSMTDHTAFIAGQIKDVFVKSADLDDAFRRERQAFLTLCQEGLTLARIRHMLDNGRPLKN